MKKKYITPSASVINIISCEELLGISNGSALGDEYNSSDVSYVKEEKTPNYNVWDDDWSNQ